MAQKMYRWQTSGGLVGHLTWGERGLYGNFFHITDIISCSIAIYVALRKKRHPYQLQASPLLYALISRSKWIETEGQIPMLSSCREANQTERENLRGIRILLLATLRCRGERAETFSFQVMRHIITAGSPGRGWILRGWMTLVQSRQAMILDVNRSDSERRWKL